MKYALWLPILLLAAACSKPSGGNAPAAAGTPVVAEAKAESGALFKDDLEFLAKSTGLVVLSQGEGRAEVAVSPDLQGRVLTSTAGGARALSFGWINRELLGSKESNPHLNAFGGEDRFWLGPEGGQFSIFFKEKDPFDLEHWFTPPPVNAEPFEVVSKTATEVQFRKPMRLVNYSGTAFDVEVRRIVRLLDAPDVERLGVPAGEGVRMVAFHSDNQVVNAGKTPWTKAGGLLSIWILGMFNPSDATTIVVPFRKGPEAELGPIVNDAYFGKVPAERLAVREAQGVLFFKGDGKFRSKIGLPPRRALPFAGSYDADHRVLTIVHLTVPKEPAEYVNSMWEIQKDPFAGDVVNSYNDGPSAPGAKPLGPFYELESSSPAAALAPGGSLGHIHTTMHFQGDDAALDRIARAVLGVGLDDIRTAFSDTPGR